ncbi:restriction endonuclease subunit S [Bradyrhizobium sp. CW10]|uniref:restriction endonuclease subunit S n=1 Tax=Bradyrhizobium sp. CW10 TaxID=2782683 RepID=UPI001FFB1177|nr:restriction endonuclease subunit S [Bradyrhizobium sp. CW10]MCK1472833.1 restriction endonuclease subunit S [Bradyrhizobium sp. CW10]
MTTVPEKVEQAYGQLPAGWRLEKLKFFASVFNSNVDKTIAENEEPVRLCNYTDVYYNNHITPDLDFMEGSATTAEVEKFQLKGGQVIITKDSEGWDDIGIPALVTEDMPNVLCGYHLSVLEPGLDLDGGFLSWLCRSEPLNDQFKLGANGVTRYGLGQYPMKNAYIALPRVETQRRIARFLDEKTARIDALIEKKRMLLDRLAEESQARITHAVTKGLNPDAPLKSSRVNWLGDVPAHWEVLPVKRVAKLESGHTPDKKIDAYWENCDIPWVSLNDTAVLRSADYISDTRFNINALGLANSSARLLPPRAVVFTRDATIGESAITTRSMAVSQHIIAWLCNEERIVPEFLLLVIYGMTAELLRLTNGSTISTIGLSDVKSIVVALPPLKEQSEIISATFDGKGKIAIVSSQIEASISRLVEYRAALVAAAVTGKIQLDAMPKEPALEEV